MGLTEVTFVASSRVGRRSVGYRQEAVVGPEEAQRQGEAAASASGARGAIGVVWGGAEANPPGGFDGQNQPDAAPNRGK